MTLATRNKEPIIEVKNISKQYNIGMDRTYKTFAESFTNVLKSPIKSLQSIGYQHDIFWALKDINFEVNRGEVVGIIGRNGAGKSTLLKILSRITSPTDGEIRLKGRVGSLLEVGTGFHPELTGRENIYFNGAILGMKKKEIDDKFDEIVKFSGVEKFLDTPVKRYSSGMQVRLAFSVAANLDPEILIVDEVLAVGDAAFQKKCLGKMGEVAESGRTVLFVSHNMGAIEALCSRVLLIEKGTKEFDGEINRGINYYLNNSMKKSETSLADRDDRIGSGKIQIEDIDIGTNENHNSGFWQTGKDCILTFKYIKNNFDIEHIDFGLSVLDLHGNRLFSANTITIKKQILLKKSKGEFRFSIKKLPLTPGDYYLTYDLYERGILLDKIEYALKIPVENGDYYGTGEIWGGYATFLIDFFFNSE